ncbi:MAG: anthranilate synthase component I family protein [Acidobacteria bacterium]|nr:anthranilate synthase component I family protein [Acidobacteriota bacterium]
MPEITIAADELIGRLLELSRSRRVCILDSCGVGHLGSKFLIAGIDPVETVEITELDPKESLRILDRAIGGELPCIFTLSYELGLLLNGISSRHSEQKEPHAFLARFENLIVYNYATDQAFVLGSRATEVADLLLETSIPSARESHSKPRILSTSFSKPEYLDVVREILEEIRSGNTYQTNIVQNFEVELDGLDAQTIFARLRRDHPAAFAAFIPRDGSTVVSASPERFFRINEGSIEASPIKGTAARVGDEEIDRQTRERLLNSRKDRAENTMIVDLLRNDLGRICEFGTVRVTKLCELEEHPTLFHLVSTINGVLKPEIAFSDVVRALFPCGSITGAPKISTMRIIDRIEKVPRGLSMGAIGYSVPRAFETEASELTPGIDTSVAIRTMTIRGKLASFATGGGIVSDSEPDLEYREMLLKAKALLAALELNLGDVF